jgi:hypothetical protein
VVSPGAHELFNHFGYQQIPDEAGVAEVTRHDQVPLIEVFQLAPPLFCAKFSGISVLTSRRYVGKAARHQLKIAFASCTDCIGAPWFRAVAIDRRSHGSVVFEVLMSSRRVVGESLGSASDAPE